MAQQPSVNLPAGFGGLTRFKEEYESKFNLRPELVILFVILIILFRIALPFLIK
jgi:preprotein translocase subunit Sec61beta